eukprot:CAMPEP_0181332256 /NCGR_PEP_ID=MMETSP1101-20121128/24986_1 /TAXON_ID=46948 /ORGANISM="Rhodomonas abbreviata, Strain Caron Lab Isolate" /LENGTH=53 /DNA_ID=CAMNT_0023441867 /DNA_START=82 /DNA_END=243 /DNA_ORIENTATION=+
MILPAARPGRASDIAIKLIAPGPASGSGIRGERRPKVVALVQARWARVRVAVR